MQTQFDIPIGESVEVLKQVLPLMSRQRVPTIPQNYAVWYEYVAKTNSALTADLEARIGQGEGFDAETCRALYEKFCLAELHAGFDGLRDEVRGTVESVVSELAFLGEDMTHFSGVLDHCGESLKLEPSAEALHNLVIDLVTETGRTRARGQAVQGALVTMANELAELRGEVDRLNLDSRTDALTGVANRRAFDESLTKMMKESLESGQPFSLMLVDIDGFKALNDAKGHLLGDKVLRFVAQEMEQCVKGRDMLARYGGDEFAVLLPSTSIEGASMLGESIRVIIKAQPFRNEEGEALERLTISLGVAQYVPGEDLTTFIERADACLYLSKNKGRDCVTSQRELKNN